MKFNKYILRNFFNKIIILITKTLKAYRINIAIIFCFLSCRHLHTCTILQQITNHNIYSIHINIKRVEEVKQQFHLSIHNCYCQSSLHGACSELLGCHIFLTCTVLWGVFPLVLHTLHCQ